MTTTNPGQALADLPLLPRDNDGPVFSEAWQANAFAIVVELIESHTISRDEWALSLSTTLKDAEARGEVNTGERYYDHWLTALEALIIDKKLAGTEDLISEGQSIRDHDHHRREGQLHHNHDHS
ncbi:MAG: nitrile hydratase accessory protein [Woeseiaceae bacterium]|nr:nitrile hydratase accessory protein [Woeseiaceae bacterium]